jgi:uncharacterized protein YaaQ
MRLGLLCVRCEPVARRAFDQPLFAFPQEAPVLKNLPTTLLLAVIQPEDSAALLGALAEAGFGATYVAARGGFLRHHAVAVLTLAPTSRIAAVIEAARATCARRRVLVTPVAEAEFGYIPEPIEVEVGGAVVFALPAASLARWGVMTRPPQRHAVLAGSGQTLGPGLIATSANEPQEAPVIDHEPTKLIVAIVPDHAANKVVAALVERQIGATTIGSTGGFLRRGNTTILSGVPAAQAEETARLIESTCRAEGDGHDKGGGIAFALDVDWRMRL